MDFEGVVTPPAERGIPQGRWSQVGADNIQLLWPVPANGGSPILGYHVDMEVPMGFRDGGALVVGLGKMRL